jgi:hypothetical protein
VAAPTAAAPSSICSHKRVVHTWIDASRDAQSTVNARIL